MNRRNFVLRMGGGLALAAQVGRAQKPALPVIGFLNSATPELYEFNVAAFRSGLETQGYVEGRNVEIAYRWAHGNYDRLPALAAELADARVSVIAATGDVGSARAAKAATTTIPIVFTIGGDPVKFGLVNSYAHPGGNVTGISFGPSAMGGKRMELLRDLVPNATVALLMNPDNPNAATEQAESQEAARVLGQRIVVLQVRNDRDFEKAFDTFVNARAGALYVATDPMLLSQRAAIAAFAARQKVPSISFVREFAAAGGLLSYGPSISAMYHEAGAYAGKILKGGNPSDLPVLQLAIIELVVNLKTARVLGITVPQSLLLRANDVIQ